MTKQYTSQLMTKELLKVEHINQISTEWFSFEVPESEDSWLCYKELEDLVREQFPQQPFSKSVRISFNEDQFITFRLYAHPDDEELMMMAANWISERMYERGALFDKAADPQEEIS